MLEALKEQVWRANLELVKQGLVKLTFGNASGIDRRRGLVVIKPSGVSYEKMTAADMVVVDLDGCVAEGKLAPSSDTPTHVRLYRAFEDIGGVAHTHSVHATIFAQARQEIPCLGTTHADHFNGPVPVTRVLTAAEVEADYEANTGAVIVERFAKLNPAECPAVLVAGHGPFAWGKDAADAAANAAALEAVAQIALGVIQLGAAERALEEYVQAKHFKRKHGKDAYYGQK